MQIERLITEPQHLELLSNLYQFYVYDSSGWALDDIQGDGRYAVSDTHLARYWQSPGWRAELILADGCLAGFVLIERLAVDGQTYDELADLFVLPKYRRLGIASLLVEQILAERTGPWLVCFYDQDAAAKQFWQRQFAQLGLVCRRLPAQGALHRYSLMSPVH